MNVLIGRDIFNEPTNQLEAFEVLYLISILEYKDRYKFYIDDEISKTSIVNHYINGNFVDVLNERCQQYLIENPDIDYTVTNVRGARNFTCNEAIRFFSQPVSIILENSRNDSHFIDAIFRAFDPTGQLFEHRDNLWLQYDNAGGCGNVINFLKGRLSMYGKDERLFRCYVILDGDKRYPTETIKKYDKLKEQLDRWGIKYHVLHKRCMENYLPIVAFPACDWLNAYKFLSVEQRDYLNIGHGFYGDLKDEERKTVQDKTNRDRSRGKDKNKRKKSYVWPLVPGSVKAFYGDVSLGNIRKIEMGMGLPSFKVKFPEYFDDTNVVTQDSLLAVTAHQPDKEELKHIVDEIKSLL